MQNSTAQFNAAPTGLPSVTVFICANCARAAESPLERNRHKSVVPELDWPLVMHRVVVPCVGRLQPEHLLKVFEAGSDATVVLACAEDNCHYHEGSRRCHRRIEYVGRLLDEIGLGKDRLILAHLPGSAREDLAAGHVPKDERERSASMDRDCLARSMNELRAYVMARIAALPSDPMHKTLFPETADCQLDDQDESDD